MYTFWKSTRKFNLCINFAFTVDERTKKYNESKLNESSNEVLQYKLGQYKVNIKVKVWLTSSFKRAKETQSKVRRKCFLDTEEFELWINGLEYLGSNSGPFGWQMIALMHDKFIVLENPEPHVYKY